MSEGKKPPQTQTAPALGSDTIVIQWRIPQWFPNLAADTLTKLKKFHDELLKFNKVINLISVKTIGTADAVHIADSILAARIIKEDSFFDHIYDFGSGNGCPGIVFSILYPEIRVSMVEFDQRKAEFLKHCIAALRLENAEVLIRSVEDLPDKSINTAMSRGFASIGKSILMARKAFVRGGIFYHIKSEEWATEVGQIPSQLCSFWQPGLVSEYKLPAGPVKYAVVKTEKIAD